MKKSKMITINEELEEHLNSITNVSGLINELLLSHFSESIDFKKLRMKSRLRVLKAQREDLNRETKRLSDEWKALVELEKSGKVDIVEDVSTKTFTRQGAMERQDREQRDEAQ